MTDLSATVLGAGQVGLGVSASLALAGFRVTLLACAASVGALRDATITVDGPRHPPACDCGRRCCHSVCFGDCL